MLDAVPPVVHAEASSVTVMASLSILEAIFY